jgi:serine/threonine protein kinase
MGNNVAGGEKSYKIKRTDENKIGEGSFAEVYKVTKRGDKKEVFAAKIFKIQNELMCSSEQLGQERELQILRDLEHPFILK